MQQLLEKKTCSGSHVRMVTGRKRKKASDSYTEDDMKGTQEGEK